MKPLARRARLRERALWERILGRPNPLRVAATWRITPASPPETPQSLAVVAVYLTGGIKREDLEQEIESALSELGEEQ
jgi:hypothetical protein